MTEAQQSAWDMRLRLYSAYNRHRPGLKVESPACWQRQGPMTPQELAQHRQAWQAFNDAELFACMGLGSVPPERMQAAIAQQASKRREARAEPVSGWCLALRPSIEALGNAALLRLLDEIGQLISTAETQHDLYAYLQQVELEFLRPIAWRSIGNI